MIPVYSLLENSRGGHSLIEIVQSDQGRAVEPAFLIPHRKDYYLFVFVKAGNSRHWVDAMPYVLKPDTFYFTTPHQVHLKEEMKPLEGFAIRFSEAFLQLEENRLLARLPIIQNAANGHALTLSATDVAFCESILPKLVAEFNGNAPFRNQMLSALLQELLIKLSRLYTEQYAELSASDGRVLLRGFLKLVNEYFSGHHDVASYASMLHLTPDYLNDLVKQQSGKTALTHIHERIMVEAKRNLLHTNLSVKEIADQLGFADAAYFNRFFKRLGTMTPIQYREQIREMYR